MFAAILSLIHLTMDTIINAISLPPLGRFRNLHPLYNTHAERAKIKVRMAVATRTFSYL